MFLENNTKSPEQIGSIKVICGSMFSGKTEELIRLVKKSRASKMKTIVFKPSVFFPKFISRCDFAKFFVDCMYKTVIIWKTNKEYSDEYPAYVYHYTDFSPGRAEMLKKEIKISNDKNQIELIFKEQIELETKKGWNRYDK